MKWLILLMLVACGKHQEPTALDYRDSDGDHVQNAYESDLDKYIANFEQLGIVRGKISVLTDNVHTLTFGNDQQNVSALKLITANEARLKKENYFSDSRILNLEVTKDLVIDDAKMIAIHVKFDSMTVKPDELYLTGNDTERKLADWSQEMKLHLFGEELRKLVTGELKLSVRKKLPKSKLFPLEVDESIKEKTYRVHYFDGADSKVMYVANNLEFSELIRLLNLPEPLEITEDDIFFNASTIPDNRWFIRSMKSGDKVLVYSSLEKLHQELLKNYEQHKTVIMRENGTSKTSLKLKNKQDARIYMRIKSPVQVLRTFVEGSYSKRHGTGGGGGMNGNGGDWYNCTHYTRTIKTEKTVTPGLQNLLENLLILSKGADQKSNDFFAIEPIEKMEDSKVFWETKIENSSEQLELVLPTLNENTFTVTGEYKNSCGNSANRGRGAAYRTNTEGQLSFEIETFVEKID